MYIKNIDYTKKRKKRFFIFTVFIIIITFNYIFIFKSNYLISFIKLKNEIKRNENHLKICIKNKENIIKQKKINNPKISIISPVYNNERYIMRFLKSIQIQNYKSLEIILIDDYSKDNSVNLIEKVKQNYNKLILIKNKKNKGTFISRNLGVLFSKGKYLILPDPDDLLSKNILRICYKIAEKYNYEIIRYNMYIGDGKMSFNEVINKIENMPIIQPELSSFLFYGSNTLQIIDWFITNKFIKKEVFIRALNSLNNFYLNIFMTFMEDSIINYMIYREAKSYYYIKMIGYYYIKNSKSITNNLFKINAQRIKFIFICLKFIFDFSKNTKYEKDMANLLFIILYKNFNFENNLLKLLDFSPDFIFYFNIINKYLNCKFITYENKLIIKNLKNILLKKYKHNL